MKMLKAWYDNININSIHTVQQKYQQALPFTGIGMNTEKLLSSMRLSSLKDWSHN